MSIALALLLTFLSPLPPEVPMCSCIPNPPPLAALEDADFVFSGLVTDIDTNHEEAYPRLDVNMVTMQIWKGNIESKVVIETANNSAACGFPFEERKNYIVYGYVHQGRMNASLCSRTALLSNAEEDLRELADLDFESHGSRCGGPGLGVVFQTFLFLFVGIFLLKLGKAVPLRSTKG